MAKLLILSIIFFNHEVLSQILRQPELYGPLIESILESPRQYNQQVETPRQYQPVEPPRYITHQIIERNGYNVGDFTPIPRVLAPDYPIDISNFPISIQSRNIPNSPINTPNFAINAPNFAINTPNFAINNPNYPIDTANFARNAPNFAVNTPNFPINAPNFPLNTPNFAISPNFAINTPNFATNNPNYPIDTPNFAINTPNFAINNPNVQTLTSDCSPSICKNLANTIQLMVLSDMLQNQERGNAVLRIAAPILSDILSRSPSSRFSNSIVPTGSRLVKSFSPNVLAAAPSVVVPPISPRVGSVSPNVDPNFLSSVSSNGRIDRGLLTSLLKSLGGGV